MSKLLYIARISARQKLAERGALLARVAFFALILFVFSRLWGAVVQDHAIPEAQPHQLVWYLAITEWIILSIPSLYLDIEGEVRRGELSYRLARPVPYPAAKLFEGLGELMVRLVALGGAGLVLAWLIAGALPVPPAMMLWLLPLGLMAGVLGLLASFAVGLTSFWLHDCRPVYWLWQKALFLLGGLLVPLELYPAWLRRLAELTPCEAILHGPASLVLGAGPQQALQILAQQCAWTLTGALLLAWLFRRALRRLEIGGG